MRASAWFDPNVESLPENPSWGLGVEADSDHATSKSATAFWRVPQRGIAIARMVVSS
jgi:hypothetical protein